MKLNLLFSGLIAIVFLSCRAKKNISLVKGEINNAIENAIADFLQSKQGRIKKDSVFSIYVENINEDVLGIGISAERDKIALFTKNEVDYDYRFFPTRIYEQGGKLFYWKDSTINVSQEIIKKLYALNRVDTAVYQKIIPERTIDEAQKVTHYYYCKNDLYQFQKKRTSIAMNEYQIPRVDCKKP